MNVRELVGLVRPHIPRTVVVSALALGLTATALAPAPASAGPINPMPGPSYLADLVPTFKAGPAKTPRSRVFFTAYIKNRGSSDANGVRVIIDLPPGFTNVTGSYGSGTVCPGNDRQVSCPLHVLPGGAEVLINIAANAPAATGQYNVRITVDPDNSVKESNETNNITNGTIVVY